MIDPALHAAALQSQAAVDAGSGDAYDHAILALAASEAGDIVEADRLFAVALAMEPGNPATLTSLAIHLRRQARFGESLTACDQAIKAYPSYADAWLERAVTLAGRGEIGLAKLSFTQAAQLAPDKPNAHAGLAALAARAGDGALARQFADAALAIDPLNAVAINALASVELTAGNLTAAAVALDRLLPRLQHASFDRSMTYSLLGDLAHRRGQYDVAHDHFVAAKADFAAVNQRAAAGQMTHIEFVEAIIRGLETGPAPFHPAGAPRQADAGFRHIFLIGYPRSGTTLVENILASLPDVFAVEEKPTFWTTDTAYIAGRANEIVAGLQRFAALAEADLASHRAAYWDQATRLGLPAGAAAFVDMDPLKATRLPFIARLFPEARILIMRRDPRDVVWSCFRTNFALASGTMEYVSLERAARHYDAMMRLTMLALERLPVATHIVDYHQLVQNFEAETQAMCAFAGLKWTQSVREFDRTAVQRGVSTASAGQVQRGLYDGTRQWEPYARYLAPVMPILQPWIERFGYS
jgi:Tfp pilus assembly protein PilF